MCGEVSARHFIQLKRKLELREARQSFSQVINRVIRNGQRAVSAAIGYFQFEILIKLFASLNGDQQFLSILDRETAAVGIQRVFGIDQFMMVFQQPVDAVRRSAFFVGRQRHDDVAIGLIIFFL